MKLRINYKLILFISLFFSLLVGSKFYGFGIDYYSAYRFSNVDYGSWYDRGGWIVSTFTIFDKNIGVYLVSFLLSLSFGIFFKKFQNFRGTNSIIFFILVYIMSLHTWPIIMSTSNAMRQGITMSLAFISLSFLLEKKIFKSFLFMFVSIFMHKSGIILLIIYINVLFLKFISDYLKENKYISNLYIIYGVIILFFIYYLILFSDRVEVSFSKIIEKDYRFHFVLISLVYVLIFSYKFKFLKNNSFCLFLYLFSFGILSILLLGLNWEYERFMMMMTLPYIFMFSMLFTKTSSYLFLFISISSLLLLTIYNGMYAALI